MEPNVKITPLHKSAWPLHFVYAHGDAENLIAAETNDAPDLIGSDRDPEQMEDGIHLADICGGNGLLFLWSVKDKRRGLAVLISDDDSMIYASDCFSQRREDL